VASRRKFLQTAAGGAALALAGSSEPFASLAPGHLIEQSASGSPATGAEGSGLLTDPRYAPGAKFRLGEFVNRGADPKEAEAIFGRLTSLDADPWVAAWSELAARSEEAGDHFERQARKKEAGNAYNKAVLYYGIAKFPVLNHPSKQNAYRKCIAVFQKAIRYWDPPVERVEVPFEGSKMVGYLRKPAGIARPAVVIATGGVDVYKEERDYSDLLGAGMAAFAIDMPGNGECPVWYTPDAERWYKTAIDYLQTRSDLDAGRIGLIGRSYGGYWGAKMAYVEPRRLKACVQWGGPIHHTFQEPWLRYLRTEKLYLWSLLDSMIYANHVKDYDELVRTAPALSLQQQGWLEKPAAPMLAVNGDKDPWISIEDVYLLLKSGEPKSARVFANASHMGRGFPGGGGNLVMTWLRKQLRVEVSSS
jgi:esterase FrsA